MSDDKRTKANVQSMEKEERLFSTLEATMKGLTKEQEGGTGKT